MAVSCLKPYDRTFPASRKNGTAECRGTLCPPLWGPELVTWGNQTGLWVVGYDSCRGMEKSGKAEQSRRDLATKWRQPHAGNQEVCDRSKNKKLQTQIQWQLVHTMNTVTCAQKTVFNAPSKIDAGYPFKWQWCQVILSVLIMWLHSPDDITPQGCYALTVWATLQPSGVLLGNLRNVLLAFPPRCHIGERVMPIVWYCLKRLYLIKSLGDILTW